MERHSREDSEFTPRIRAHFLESEIFNAVHFPQNSLKIFRHSYCVNVYLYVKSYFGVGLHTCGRHLGVTCVPRSKVQPTIHLLKSSLLSAPAYSANAGKFGVEFTF